MTDEVRSIIEGITEYYENPIRVGSRCEANCFYRVEEIKPEDLRTLAEYLAERIINVCSPNLPEVLINLPGSFTKLAALLSRELAPPGEMLEVLALDQVVGGNGKSARLKGTTAILVNDVITTARSCLEAHTKVTLLGAQVLCWAALVDRTFGPGPVPVVTTFTGEPVRLLEELP